MKKVKLFLGVFITLTVICLCVINVNAQHTYLDEKDVHFWNFTEKMLDKDYSSNSVEVSHNNNAMAIKITNTSDVYLRMNGSNIPSTLDNNKYAVISYYFSTENTEHKYAELQVVINGNWYTFSKELKTNQWDKLIIDLSTELNADKQSQFGTTGIPDTGDLHQLGIAFYNVSVGDIMNVEYMAFYSSKDAAENSMVNDGTITETPTPTPTEQPTIPNPPTSDNSFLGITVVAVVVAAVLFILFYKKNKITV